MTTPRTDWESTSGFSFVELLVATTIAALVTAAILAIVDPAGGAFQVQPESADVEQRLRAAEDALMRDLVVAGGVPFLSDDAGPGAPPLSSAAVFPLRVGRVGADPPGSFVGGRLTLWSVDLGAPQARLVTPLGSVTGAATFRTGSGCHEGAASCGFRTGSTVVVFGAAGAWDAFSVSGVAGDTLTLQHVLSDSPQTHPAGSVIAEATVRTFLLKDDPVSGLARLSRYDPSSRVEVPVVDHVVGLTFDFIGDVEPPMLVVGSGSGAVERVTYGPAPPPLASRPTSYPPGENCAFVRTPAGAALPRLQSLAPGPGLIPLQRAWLVDGPWCPDDASPNRYDADLLRVRQVVATIRVEAAVAALRGPAGVLFARAGTSRNTRMVPDRTARLVITPRPFTLGR